MQPQATELDGRPVKPALGWAVHLFTASGVIISLLAIDALLRHKWREVLLWLLLALVIDGVDGTLARAVRIKESVPRIDGEALDLIVDYLNYVFIPTLLMWRGGLFPDSIELPLSAMILLSSLYVFVRRDMKTDDGYFRGVPALWNVVALYFVLTQPDAWLSAAIVLALVALTFAPILFVHPFRSADCGRPALAIASIWALSTLLLLLVPNSAKLWNVLLYCSIGSALALVLLGIVRTFRRREPA